MELIINVKRWGRSVLEVWLQVKEESDCLGKCGEFLARNHAPKIITIGVTYGVIAWLGYVGA